jgi:hypothetical protein
MDGNLAKCHEDTERHKFWPTGMDIGNGYGVPGGGSYDLSRAQMYSIPSSALPPEGPRQAGPSQAKAQKGPVFSARASLAGPQNGRGPVHGPEARNGDASASTSGSEGGETGPGGNLPDYLKNKLKARGILKDGPAEESVPVRVSVSLTAPVK